MDKLFSFLLLSLSISSYHAIDAYNETKIWDLAYVDFVRKYALLNIATRLQFVQDIPTSFELLQENHSEIDLMLNGNHNTDTTVRELREIARIRNLINMPDLTEYPHANTFENIEDDINIYLERYIRDLIEGNAQWPYYVYHPVEGRIYISRSRNCPRIIGTREYLYRTDVLPIALDNLKHERRFTDEILRKRTHSKDIRYKFDMKVFTPKEIEDELEDNMSRHHIIPIATLVPFLDRFHAIQQIRRESVPDDYTRILNLQYVNNIRYRIGELLECSESFGYIRNLLENNEFNLYEKSLFTWAPGNIFFGPTHRNDDPGAFLETKSRIVVPRYYDMFETIYTHMVRINDIINTRYRFNSPTTKLTREQATDLLNDRQQYNYNYEHYTGIYDYMRAIANHMRALFAQAANQIGCILGIQFDHTKWEKVNEKWQLKTYDINNYKNQRRYQPPDDDGPGGSCPSLQQCSGRRIMRRALNNGICDWSNHLKIIHNDTRLQCEYDQYKKDLKSYSRFLKDKIFKADPYVKQIICDKYYAQPIIHSETK